MKMFLIREELWKVVNEPVPPAPVPEAWSKLDEKAYSTIALSLEPSQYTIIKTCVYARDLWTELQQFHEKATASSQLSLLIRLCDAKVGEEGDVEKHLLEMDALFEELQNAGLPLAEKLQIAMILRSMPQSYHFLASTLEARPDQDITMVLVRSKLLDEYRKREEQRGPSAGEEQVLKVAAGKQKVCFFCSKPGHYKRDCRKFLALKEKRSDGESDGNKTGAIKKKHAKQAKEAKETTSEAVSFSAREVEEAVCSTYAKPHSWTIDSGASCHMTSCVEFFDKLEQSSVTTVTMADGNRAKSDGVGCGTVRTVDGTGKHIDIDLNNVLFVPDLDGGLLSVGKIAEKGFDVKFNKNGVEILDSTGRIVALGEKNGGLYVLKEAGQTALAVGQCHTANCQHTWHRRFGHRDPAILDRIRKEGLVAGVKVVDCGANTVCECCLEGKMARLPYPQQAERRTTQPLQLVHTDLCGPMQNVTPGGNKYFMAIIDDYSRYVVLYLLKDKAEAKGCIINYVRFTENQFGRKPAIIRSDRGGEFVNKELDQFYRSEGIQSQLTAGYSPQQNGVAERRNRYLKEMAVCMLLDAGLEKRFWGEAIAAAAYIQNRLPSRSVQKTPFELWTGHKPDVGNLKVFGCQAYVHIPDVKRSKLDSKAEKLIFVGYDCKAKAYRFLDQAKGKIIISRDARFLEVGSDLQEEKVIVVPDPDTELVNCDGDKQDPEQDDAEYGSPPNSEPDSGEDWGSIEDESEFEGYFSDIDSEFEGENADPGVRQLRARPRRRPRRFDDFVVGVAKAMDNEPTTYQEGVSCKDKEKWLKAMKEEYQSHLSRGTWSLVPPPPDRPIIGSKWVFQRKKDTSGQVVRYKARLVAQGYSQQYGLDFGEVFAPVAMQSTFRVLLTIAGQRKLAVRHIDVKNAYLNGKLEEDIYMRQPRGFVPPGQEELVCKLHKSLYGLKQSARVWNTTVKAVLLKLGFQQSESDSCLFMKRLASGKWIYLLIYVDDMIVVCEDSEQITHLEKELQREFDISTLGNVSQFLGMKVRKDTDGFYRLSQKAFIREIAARFGLAGAKKSGVPLDVGYFKQTESDKLPDNKQFHSLVGALLYVSTNTRPDIAVAVSILSRKTSAPTQHDWTELKRVVRYLIGTEDFELKLGVEKTAGMTLTGYSDADWAGDRSDRKSTSGFVFLLGGAPVVWASRKQGCVTTSTMEAEYLALSDAAQEAVWLRRLLGELDEEQQQPTTINEDNRSCIDFVALDRQNKRSKHIDTKYHHAKDLCGKGVIQLRYCSTNEMIADIFTKPLGPTKVKRFAEALGLVRPT